jgi:hypothetical protein
MQSYEGLEVLLHPFLTFALDEMNGQIHALPAGKDPK